MSSVFDPDSFLNTETSDANETHYTPVPEDEYMAMIEGVTARMARTKNGDSPILSLMWKILEQDELAEKLGFRDGMRVKQDLWLDLEPDGSISIGPNKNVKLGKVRDAVGQNKAGKAWAPRQLEGAGPCVIVVSQRPDDDDSEIIYNDVKRVAAA